MPSVTPVILSGGMGSRLWPLSRRDAPKQFQPIDAAGGPSFLQATALRHRGPLFHAPVVVGAAAHVPLIVAQLAEVDSEARILGEPMGRNTGPAVLAAALRLLRDDPDAVLLVLPSDHVVEGDLDGTVALALDGAREDGRIVSIGVAPRYPETGFGYITDGGGIEGRPGLHDVAAFVEKPDIALATRLVEEGRSYWASGISMMRADVIVEEFARLEPATLAAVRRALAEGETSGDTLLLAAQPFAAALNEPTERAIFERSGRVALAPAAIAWSDVGAWPAVHGLAAKTAAGNALGPEVLAIDTRNTLVRGCGRLIAVVGLDDVIVVDTPDALLVTTRASAQRVKDVVTQLQQLGRREVDSPVHLQLPRTEPAAGGTARHAVAPGKARRIVGASPAGSVVIVAAGMAVLKIDGAPVEARAGEVVLVRAGEAASIGNPGPNELTLVAVDLGDAGAAGAPTAQAALLDGARHGEPEGRAPETGRHCVA